MIRKLTYVLIALCISFFAMHIADGAVAGIAQVVATYDSASYAEQCAQKEQLQTAALSDCYISEVAPKQTAARPSNVSVPSPARTIQANGTFNSGSTQANGTSSSNRTTALSVKSETAQKRLYSIVTDNKARLLPFGFTDLSDHFLSLCKLII